ncbi:MAG: hypothetical protein M5U28_48315 [Sandaracinaceae bacterium]|nr:hypothetical protein [Sandaracinaceae bacterium]
MATCAASRTPRTGASSSSSSRPRGKRAFRGELDFYRQLIDQTLSPLGDEARRVVLRALTRLPASRG